ncbi:hypothetical protein ACK8P5_26675 (plasmid) [Paenibacillus sp. EC2-1]|uniref:hypothetical protein n=1 Tax=Paenibacillus sp. EC2-1 TaxID=3388665 RepID=UPI003BEF47B8
MRKKRKKTNNYWSNGLSVDESRISTLIILSLAFSILAIYMTVRVGDIPANLVSVIIGLVTAIAGINIAERVMSRRPVPDPAPEDIHDRQNDDQRGGDGPTI